MRPLLLPAVRRLWRDKSTLQLGRPCSTALVLEGLDGSSRAVLALLDGTRSREQVVAEPGGAPVLELLEGAGLVVDADEVTAGLRGLELTERDRLWPDAGSLSLVRGPAASRAMLARRRAQLMVRGTGRVGAPLAALLAAAGVGHVQICDAELTRPQDLSVGGLVTEDVGRPRDVALAGRYEGLRLAARDPAGSRSGAAGRPGGSARSAQPLADHLDLVVLAAGATDDADTAALLVAAGTPHLFADVSERTGSVGPLVLPGRSACLRCQELTRTDLDPGWPTLSVQLSGPSRAAPSSDGVLAVAVAAQAALQILQHLEGGSPAVVGGTIELELPDWRWRRRTWPMHVACGCAWTASRQAG